MADWPNEGLLPQPLESELFDLGLDMTVHPEMPPADAQTSFPQVSQGALPQAQYLHQPHHESELEAVQRHHNLLSQSIAPLQEAQMQNIPTFQDGQLQNAEVYQEVPFQDFAQHIEMQPQSVPQQGLSQQPALDPSIDSLSAFFINNGAWRPPVPCNNCGRKRLQCLMLKTTEDNPNPVTSCSSCVALYRPCSLAERDKRNPSAFETSVPVIGQLHGVSEEVDEPVVFTMDMPSQLPVRLDSQEPQFVSLSQEPPLGIAATSQLAAEDDPVVEVPSVTEAPRPSSKKATSRMVKRTRPLRQWYDQNMHHPYPNENEKRRLCQESGMSRTQVNNYFINRRRRMKNQREHQASQGHFPRGSPMPQSSPSDMSPLERWRRSPPDQEAVSPDALHDMLQGLPQQAAIAGTSLPERNVGDQEVHVTSSASTSQASSYSVNNTLNWLDASSNSVSSAYSNRSSNTVGLTSPGDVPDSNEASQAVVFICTFCYSKFKKKSDWDRHESTIHVPQLNSWTCTLANRSKDSHLAWEVGKTYPLCFYCGHENPTPEHIRSHELDSCAERPKHERSFARKDHLWQHLQKFHGCRKWKGFASAACYVHEQLENVRSQCGFCGYVQETWAARSAHISAHFRKGLTMADWAGDAGIEKVG